VRYDAHSGIAVLHGVGILEKGNQMAEPTSYIVKIGELEFGSFSFVHDNIPGGDDDAKQDEDVALPEAD
jgi:hypothetical protein